MIDLYLIAHKVRGEPAFDIATKMDCPECNAMGCLECDDLGYWWIVPTSGHRAYPYWSDPLQWYMDEMCDVPAMPEGLPDHYLVPSRPKLDLTSILNLRPQRTAPTQPFPRRL